MLLPGEVVVVPDGAVVRGVVVVVLGDVVEPELMPPMVVVDDVFPIGGVVPLVVFGVVPDVVFGVVPELVLGVVPVVLVEPAAEDEAPGIVVVVDAPGVTVGEVEGVHKPDALEVVAPLPPDELPIVLPVGFVDVLGVVEVTGHALEV